MRKAFTLVELLVVIAILAILAGMITATLGGFSSKGQQTQALAVIESLKAAVEAYVSDFDDFPPNHLEDMGIRDQNGLNAGCEALVACLSTQQKSGPYFDFKDDLLGNLDGDQVPDFNRSVFGVREAFEIHDPWGNPYVYFNVRAYRNSETYKKRVGSYLLGPEAEKVVAEPALSAKTGRYHNPTGYQIWSCGPDGKNDGGQGDDIASFGD